MSGGAMFRRVTGMRTGYHPEEVDDFFTHARTVYEQGPAGALSSRDVRTARRRAVQPRCADGRVRPRAQRLLDDGGRLRP